MGAGIWQQERLVIGMSVFTVSTWLACVLTHVCICLPASRSWQIKPYPGDNCTIRPPNYVVIATLNVLTDFGIILIPMPLLFKVKVPLRHKIILGFLFSSGIFVIIATILRAYYSLKSISDLPIALGWADRETFVATLVVCAPGIKPLFNNTKFFRSSSNGSKPRTPSKGISSFSGFGKNSKNSSGNATSVTHAEEHSGKQFEMSPINWRRNTHGTKRLSSRASDERVIMYDTYDGRPIDDPKDIFVTKEYTVLSEDAGDKV
ncbi:MAG: hypothetical protein M1820_009626 [Bogoriella megaspora]|nr:MAG: hypothetical protein M1820_009626 [Bogoriella megaspora]